LDPYATDTGSRPACAGERIAACSSALSHEPLVDLKTFDAAQQILIARGRTTPDVPPTAATTCSPDSSTCTRCGARFIGGAANGNKYRYRCYTCFTRHRYGVSECATDRLPAEELDRIMLDRLLDTYSSHDILERALAWWA
jgi:site-specific DNA recombinase